MMLFNLLKQSIVPKIVHIVLPVADVCVQVIDNHKHPTAARRFIGLERCDIGSAHNIGMEKYTWRCYNKYFSCFSNWT